MKFPVLNIDGAKSDSIEISDKLVKLKVNHKLIKFVIDWQLNHSKPRIAKTKQRNERRPSLPKNYMFSKRRLLNPGEVVKVINIFILIVEIFFYIFIAVYS